MPAARSGRNPAAEDAFERAHRLSTWSVGAGYLGVHSPGKATFLPTDVDTALETRSRDRFYDRSVHQPMQKIVGDKIRPAGTRDAYGVELVKKQVATSYATLDRQRALSAWAMGDAFTLADCAAAPALDCGNLVAPIGDAHKNTAAYLARRMKRPSFARVLEEAKRSSCVDDTRPPRRCTRGMSQERAGAPVRSCLLALPLTGHPRPARYGFPSGTSGVPSS